MTISFYLHNQPDKDGKHLIMCRYSHRAGSPKGREWRFAVKKGGVAFKVEKKTWRNGRVKKSADFARVINAALDSCEKELEKICYGLIGEGKEPFSDVVRQEYTRTGTSAGFLEVYDTFLRSGSVRSLDYATQSDYKYLRGDLERFQKAQGKVSLSRLNTRQVEEFIYFLQSGGISSATIKKKLAKFRRFWDYAHTSDLTGPVRMPSFSAPAAVHVALSEEELTAFAEVDPGEMRDAQSIFLFLCFTGLRWSEYARLSGDSLQDGILVYKKSKGRGKGLVLHSVALSAPAFAVWEERFKGEPPKMRYDTIILQIKEIARLAGINSRVLTSRGEVEKWQDVSTHTGRRTFATLSSLRGMALKMISIAMGHSSSTMTERYLKLSSRDAHRATREAWDD